MKLTSEYPLPLFWRTFNEHDTVYWVGLREGILSTGQSVDINHPLPAWQLELKQYNLQGPFVMEPGRLYTNEDNLIVSYSGQVKAAASPTAVTSDLILWWNSNRGDNFSTATPQGNQSCLEAGYRRVRSEGRVFTDWQPGTVPLRLYWHPGREDNFVTATPEGEYSAIAAGYVYVRVEGWIYRDQQPNTIPLRTYWNGNRGDNCEVATASGQRDQENSGYIPVRVEGYVLKPN